ncbi:MAG: type IV pilus secretin PilQ [Bacteriovoracales bacterium]|nr:type IV pilus secretin PilQ [Bacteriovoracales bacterium]
MMGFKIFCFAILLTPVISYSSFNLESINFVQEGEISKLIFKFDKTGIKASRFQNEKDKQIILDIKDVKADSKVMRAFDTSEFEGATVFVSPYRRPGNLNDIRVAVQLRDNVRSILESINTTLVLRIENRFGVFSGKNFSHQGMTQSGKNLLQGNEKDALIKINVPKSNSVNDILENIVLSGKKRYVGKRIHIDVKKIAITDLFKMIADSSGFNIIVDESVAALPPMTLSLTDTPWDQVLDIILETSKTVALKKENILIIKTYAKAQAEKKLQHDQAKLLEVQEPLVTKIFPISYANASELMKGLKEYSTKDRGKISLDERTNQLIIRDTVENIGRMKKMIEVLDTQTPQILIEAKIVEVFDEFSQKIGLSRGVEMTYSSGGVSTGTGSSTQDSEFSFSSIGNYKDEGTALGVSVNIFKKLVGLNTTLELLEQESSGRVISSPKVITQNKKAASIVSTSSKTYRKSVSAEEGTVTYDSVSAPLSLQVTPQVTNEGAIVMEVSLQKSEHIPTEASRTGGAPPDTSSNSISTNVLVDNGSTIVIGGVYSFTEAEGHTGIPFLKEIPIFGWLFRTPYNPEKRRKELVIFLTPRIINQKEAGLEDSASEKSPLG